MSCSFFINMKFHDMVVKYAENVANSAITKMKPTSADS